MNKYQRKIKGVNGNQIVIDVYSVLAAFDVHHPAVAHAVKKLLAPSDRGAKDWKQDISEAMDSLDRAGQIGPLPCKVASTESEQAPALAMPPKPEVIACDCDPTKGEDCKLCTSLYQKAEPEDPHHDHYDDN